MALVELSFESQLSVSPAAAWSWAVSVDGIATELRPLARLTLPPGPIDEAPLGEPIARSWMLLFGVLPIDRIELTLVELEPGQRLLERSPTLSMRVWQHERRIERTDVGSKLIDRLSFEARPGLGWLVRLFVAQLFAHRHRVLRRRLGPRSR